MPVILPEEQVQTPDARAKEGPGCELTVDLELCEVWDDRGFRAPFVMHDDPETHEFRRQCLMKGMDEIALTLGARMTIERFEKERPKYLDPVKS